MKIKDAVVIDSKILMEAVKHLGILGMTDLSNQLLFQHRKLEPIIKDAYNSGMNELNSNIHGLSNYLNDTEI
jgi:hypothetical protein